MSRQVGRKGLMGLGWREEGLVGGESGVLLWGCALVGLRDGRDGDGTGGVGWGMFLWWVR